MTDKDIIKALECCGSEFECHNGCPYYHNGQFSCRDLSIYRDALALINSQQAEVERLKKETDLFADIGKMYSEIRAEAVKEFAEKLIMNITINNTNDGYLDYAVDYNCLIEDIQDLVKEMIGE